MLFFLHLFAMLLLIQGYSNGKKSAVIITGGTGVLGRALVQELCKRGQQDVYASYRSLDKAKEVLEDIREKKLSHTPKFFELNLDDTSNMPSLPLVGSCAPDHLTLINNAALFLEDNSAEAFRQSIIANTIFPVLFTQQMLDLAIQCPAKRIDVLQIGSGDGELVYLHTALASEISSLSSIPSLLTYAHKFYKTHNTEVEYAATDAPAYSVSKALLQRSVPLFHALSPPNFRILAACPGNFLSRMTTEEERQAGVQEVGQVVPSLLDLLAEGGRYRRGLFYRHGEVIPW